MGTIIIKGLRVFAYHGANPEEKENGQMFVIDMELTANMDRACISDRLEDTVSYSAVVKTVRRIMSAGRDNLIERAAWRIAEGVMLEHQQVEALTVTLNKPDAPISADFDSVAVRLSLTRSEVLGDETEDEKPDSAGQDTYTPATGRYYTAQELAEDRAEDSREQEFVSRGFTRSAQDSDTPKQSQRKSVWDNDTNPFSI